MRARLRRVLAALFGLLLWPASGAAIPVLDQQYVPGSTTVGGLGALTRAQTFTVGISGTLDSVAVLVSGQTTTSLTIEIQATSMMGAPVFGSAALASASVSFDLGSTPTFVTADLSAANLVVSAGQILAIVLQPGNASASFHFVSPGGYAAGNHFTTTDDSPSAYVPTLADIGFRTFVETPEPAAGLLLGAAALFAAERARGRRSRVSATTRFAVVTRRPEA
jgi:hypothetical protein